MRFKTRRAFTLIELMIVIVILGVLASVVMAMVTVTYYDARQASADSTAQTVQQAIGYYRERTGHLPDLIGTNWTALTEQTDVDGQPIGPFMPSPPKNLSAYGNPSSVVDTAAEVFTTTCAFAYDYNGGTGTGKFVAAKKPATP